MLQTLKVTVKVPMQQATVMPAILLLHAIAGLLQDAVFFSSGYDGGVVEHDVHHDRRVGNGKEGIGR